MRQDAFLFILWFIWKWRCAEIFRDAFSRPIRPLEHILNYIHEWEKSSETLVVDNPRVDIIISWIPPQENYVKLNIDAKCDGTSGITIGGLLRDAEGQWILGFSKAIGFGTVLQAELWAILEGLLTWKFGYGCVQVESDSLKAVQLINSTSTHIHPFRNLIAECQEAMARSWCCSLTHIFREANTVADGIAKAATSLEHNLVILSDIPATVLPFVISDCNRTAHYRSVSL